MPPTSRTQRTSGLRLERLSGFSDGVIAIAITILVLGIEVPSPQEVSQRELVDYLYDSLHPALGFILSFLTIGTYWLGHFTIFHYLTHATRVLIALNALFLLSISFLPFPTGVQAMYRNDELAMALYGIAQLICGLMLVAIWLYSVRGRLLVRSDLPEVVIRKMTLRLMIAPALSALAIGCSFISLTATRLIFFSIPFFYIISFRSVDSGWKTPSTETG